MDYGIDCLGLAEHGDVVFANVPTTFALGIFAEEFGDALPFLRNAAKAGFRSFRVHLIWDHNHDYGDQYLPKLKSLTPLYERFAVNHPNCHVELSPFCEHNIHAPDKYLDLVAGLAPHCKAVNSPLPTGGISTRYKNECHGSKARPLQGHFNFSYDGNDAYNADVEKMRTTMQHCDTFYVWGSKCNLHRTDTTPERDSPPDANYMKGLVALATPKGVTGIPARDTWKPESEKGVPVLISPIHTNHVELHRDGKVIAMLPYYGPYTDGRSRYYAHAQGFEIGLCELWINGVKQGVLNGAFRENEYR